MTVDKLLRRQFLQAGGIGVFGAFAFRANAWTKNRVLYVGTYTSGKGEGIYVCEFSPRVGAFGSCEAKKTINPSFVAIDRSFRYLYAVNEVSEYEGKPGGYVSAFAINSVSKELSF
ncbi:MAG TPA: beta-propeller fold lactonase family protein, partial [Pyrinomonadaceae bacterium]